MFTRLSRTGDIRKMEQDFALVKQVLDNIIEAKE